MSNQTWDNDPDKPEGSGDGQQPSGYSPADSGTPDQDASAPGYTPPGWGAPAPSGPSGTDAPQGGYAAPGYSQGYSAPSGSNPQQGYGQAPSTPDQSFGQTPPYGAPAQGGYDPSAGYGQNPYGSAPQGGGYDPGTAQNPYGAPQGGYDPNAGGYGAPSPYGGGYQPNPYAPSGPVLATWGRRAIGGLIDFVAPAIAISIIIGIVMPNGGYTANIASTLLAVGWWVYNTGYRVATTGYSFGHKIGKVRVVMEDTGQTPPQNTAMLRAVAHLLDELICALGFLFPLWDSKKQTFADKIAKTVVIDEQNIQR
ncbi:MAG: RDD family protein [Micropruina sp.]